MRQVLLGATLIAALAAAPAIAKEKLALKSEGTKQSSSISPEDQNRFQNPDGTFQGKPVVQGPAHSDTNPVRQENSAERADRPWKAGRTKDS